MSELKPCPFCGGEAETYETFDGWIAACSFEQSELDGRTHKAQAYGATEAEAITAWNTRAEYEIGYEDAQILLDELGIVRCRDCERFEDKWAYCNLFVEAVEDNGFCAWGERR